MNAIGYISNYIPKQHQNDQLIKNNTQDKNSVEGKDLDNGYHESADQNQTFDNSTTTNEKQYSDCNTIGGTADTIDHNETQQMSSFSDELVSDQEEPQLVGEDEQQALHDRGTAVQVSYYYYVWKVLTFLPYVLVVRPVLYIWHVITLPLTIIEVISNYKTKTSSSSHQESMLSGAKDTSERELSSKVNVSDLNKENSLVLKYDYLKDGSGSESPADFGAVPGDSSASSPAGLGSKMKKTRSFGGKFFFPKKLIPNSILNNPNKKKTLVLDLDETLIHSVSRTSSMSNKAHVIEVQFVPTSIPPIFQNTTSLKRRKTPGSAGSSSNVISTLYYVNKRPYCDLFLNKVCKWYDVVIFTASIKEYADPVINWLESSTRARFCRRLYRSHCTLQEGVGYVKDLSVLNHSLDDVIIIDNSPVSYSMNIDNAIHVESWINDPTDSDLLQLLPFLEAMRYTTDVKTVLCLKKGEEVFSQE